MSIELKSIKELPRVRREAASEYDALLDQFMESQDKYAELIVKKKVKPEGLVSGLRQRILKKEGFKGKVKVRHIQGRIYLEKLQ